MQTNDYMLWQQQVKCCKRCPLSETRTQVVLSRESVPQGEKKIFLLGEAPGGNEDQNGIPFCGAAGAVLSDLLQRLALPECELYIGNLVKCRPVKESSRPRYGAYANRKPRVSEITACTPWLMEELALVAPKLLVTLGNLPLAFALGKSCPIGEMHGRPFYSERLQIEVFPLYHPAALIYDRAKSAAYAEDLLQLKLKLANMK